MDNDATGDGPEEKTYEGWAIVELMGHRQTAGHVRGEMVGGAMLLRIDTPGVDGKAVATQYYGGSAIYCLTPCDEATARRALEDAYNLPPPVALAIAAEERRREPPLLDDYSGPADGDWQG